MSNEAISKNIIYIYEIYMIYVSNSDEFAFESDISTQVVPKPYSVSFLHDVHYEQCNS